MPRSKQIRSRLIEHRASAINPDTGERDVWTVTFQGNRIREDKAEWLRMAQNGGFTDISLTRVQKRANTDESVKPHTFGQNGQIVMDEASRAFALEMLDRLIAARKAKK